MVIESKNGKVEVATAKDLRGNITDNADWILSRNLKGNPPLEKLFVKKANENAVLLTAHTNRQKVIEVYNAIQDAIKRGDEVFKVGD